MTEEATNEEVSGLSETTDDSQWETEAGGELEDSVELTEEPAGEVEEKRAEREAAYQTKYQEGLTVLDEIDPSGGLSDAFRTGQAPLPVKAQMPQDLAEEGVTIGDLSPTQFAELQRQLNAESSATLRAEIQYESDIRNQQQALAASQQRAVKALSIATESPNPLANLNPAVLQQLSTMGINPQQTWPDHFARAYIRELQVAKGRAIQGNAVAESAAAKIQATKELQQPGAAASPDQKPKTQNEKLLDAMNATAGGDAAKEVFG